MGSDDIRPDVEVGEEELPDDDYYLVFDQRLLFLLGQDGQQIQQDFDYFEVQLIHLLHQSSLSLIFEHVFEDTEEFAQDGRDERVLDRIFLSETSQQLQLPHQRLDEALLLIIDAEGEQVFGIDSQVADGEEDDLYQLPRLAGRENEVVVVSRVEILHSSHLPEQPHQDGSEAFHSL